MLGEKSHVVNGMGVLEESVFLRFKIDLSWNQAVSLVLLQEDLPEEWQPPGLILHRDIKEPAIQV